jgi:hypothetical protein
MEIDSYTHNINIYRTIAFGEKHILVVADGSPPAYWKPVSKYLPRQTLNFQGSTIPFYWYNVKRHLLVRRMYNKWRVQTHNWAAKAVFKHYREVMGYA